MDEQKNTVQATGLEIGDICQAIRDIDAKISCLERALGIGRAPRGAEDEGVTR